MCTLLDRCKTKFTNNQMKYSLLKVLPTAKMQSFQKLFIFHLEFVLDS